MNQEELDYAEGVPASPDEPAPDPAPDPAPVRYDPILTTVHLAGLGTAIAVVIGLELAGVDQLGRGWAWLAYIAGAHSVYIPTLFLGRWLSRRMYPNHLHHNPTGCSNA